MRLRILAPLALALAVACPLVAQDKAPPAKPVSVTPVSRTDDWAMKRQDEVLKRVREAKAPVPVLFIGDSITQGWEGAGKQLWEERIAPLGALNLGVSGDRTEHVLYRLAQAPINALAPKAIVLMIGTNNLGHGSSNASDTALGVRTIVDTLTKQCPDAHIVLLAIFPRGEAFNAMRGDICQINQSLARFAHDHPSKHVEFMDLGALFVEADGSIRKEIMPDFLHLSADGYRLWADAVSPVLHREVDVPPVPAKH